jgi:hypothetical protein
MNFDCDRAFQMLALTVAATSRHRSEAIDIAEEIA